MANTRMLLLALALAPALAARTEGQPRGGPDTVVVQSGALRLRALLWRPRGHGPFPAVLFNHGSGHGVRAPTGDDDEHSMEWQAGVVGRTAQEGHGFVHLPVASWEADVFAFLDPLMR